MTHLERLPGARRSNAPCPVTLLGDPALGRLVRQALESQGLLNPLTVAPVDPTAPIPGTPCLILLDLEPNPVGALAVLRERRSRRELAATPTLVLGPAGERGLVEQAYAYGVNSYLARPTTDPELVDLLKTALDYWLRVSRIPD